MLSTRQKLVFAATCVSGAVVPLSLWVRVRGRRGAHQLDAGRQPLPDAIILGCYALPSGAPSDHLEDRLTAALNLFRQGRVQRLIVSGAAQAPTDEVEVMARWLRERGVPQERMVEDPTGVRTLATMRNAADLWGCRRAFVCTHRYHLPRSLYLAQACGIEAEGVPADRARLTKPVQILTREFAARAMASLDVFLS